MAAWVSSSATSRCALPAMDDMPDESKAARGEDLKAGGQHAGEQRMGPASG
jgi:hypothetical protein